MRKVPQLIYIYKYIILVNYIIALRRSANGIISGSSSQADITTTTAESFAECQTEPWYDEGL